MTYTDAKRGNLKSSEEYCDFYDTRFYSYCFHSTLIDFLILCYFGFPQSFPSLPLSNHVKTPPIYSRFVQQSASGSINQDLCKHNQSFSQQHSIAVNQANPSISFSQCHHLQEQQPISDGDKVEAHVKHKHRALSATYRYAWQEYVWKVFFSPTDSINLQLNSFQIKTELRRTLLLWEN